MYSTNQYSGYFNFFTKFNFEVSDWLDLVRAVTCVYPMCWVLVYICMDVVEPLYYVSNYESILLIKKVPLAHIRIREMRSTILYQNISFFVCLFVCFCFVCLFFVTPSSYFGGEEALRASSSPLKFFIAVLCFKIDIELSVKV